MAINVHTDTKFEKCLNWLSKKTGKTKTEIIKESVMEKYTAQKNGFRFGAFKNLVKKTTPEEIVKELKEMDDVYDLG